MPLRDDILNPISEEKPGGDDIRYAPVYDQIKEARREDDDADQGEWKVERKVADYPKVIRLASEAIAKKSKDLQLAAWLVEALLKQGGFAGLLEGITLLHSLVDNFWDHLYPELEDGDAEFRATPLDWVGSYLNMTVRLLPVTRAGYDLFKFKESRQVGYEADVADDYEKQEAFTARLAEGKISADQFDKSFNETPKAFYKENMEQLEACQEKLDELDTLCEEKFGEFKPSFGGLRDTLAEVRSTWRQLLNQKLEAEPDEPPPATEAAPAEASADADSWGSWGDSSATAVEEAPGAAAAPVARGALPLEPQDREDAIRRIVAAAKWLRANDQYSPVSFTILRGLRWGELRYDGATLDPLKMEAPPTEVRTNLKKLLIEGNWAEVLETAEQAAGLPAGRAWLDMQRYADRACQELGEYYSSISRAIRSGVRELVTDYPDLPDASLLDDTPCANGETKAWIQESCQPVTAAPPPPPPEPAATFDEAVEQEAVEGAEPVRDTFDIAMELASRRDIRGAIDLLSREIAMQRSGRGRFRRKMQLAQVCLSAGLDDVAAPILDELAHEIEVRKLEDWESPETIALPLTLLYRCLGKLDRPPEDKARLYSKICRLDPAQALSIER